MEKIIDKELISQLLRLGKNQQDKVLNYVKNMLTNEEMNRRADASEQAIETGKVKSFDQFNTNFENWKIQRRVSTGGRFKTPIRHHPQSTESSGR